MHLLFYDLHLVGPLNVIVGKTLAVNVPESNKATNIFIYYRGIGSFCKTIYRTIASTIKACYCIMISIAILLLHLAFCLFSLEA